MSKSKHEIGSLADIREQIKVARERADRAAQDGNFTAAGRFSKQAFEYTAMLVSIDRPARG
jgi:hypothetical protein